MTLFLNIDSESTLENAKRKLREYPRWKRIAGEAYKLDITQTFSDMPRNAGSSKGSSMESQVLRKVAAMNELDRIEKAINLCSKLDYAYLLKRKYCQRERETDYSIYTDFNWTEDMFYTYQRRALLEFAEAYSHGDLLVYEKHGENQGESW